MVAIFPYGDGFVFEKTACISLKTRRNWTYGDLEVHVQRAVEFLDAEQSISSQSLTQYDTRPKLGPGDRVAILAQNSVYHLILFLAAIRMGAIYVPLNWRLQAKELHQILEDCAPTILFVENPELVSRILPRNCYLSELDDLATAVEKESRSSLDMLSEFRVTTRTHQSQGMRYITDHEAVCLLLYTSGSTGLAKGVQHTAKSLHATVVNFAASGSISADKTPVFLVDAPMYHVIGGVVCTLVPLFFGGRILISDKFEATRTNHRLADPNLGVTHYFCVPTMADAMASSPTFEPKRWTSLDKIFTGGSPNPASRILWWLDRGIRMVDGYGMTETGTICTMPTSSKSIADVLRAKAGSVGLPAPLTQIRLENSYGREVGINTPGEVLVAGPHVSTGYWSAKLAPDSSVVTRTSSTVSVPSGWFRTGDIGKRDKDGFIYIVDRKKDMYISGGENVFPAEIESTIISHPLIKDAAVIGVPHSVWGEVGCAFVVAGPGSEILALDAVLEHCRQHLAPFKAPKHCFFVKELPRNASGKVLKNDLRGLFEGTSVPETEKSSLDMGVKEEYTKPLRMRWWKSMALFLCFR